MTKIETDGGGNRGDPRGPSEADHPDLPQAPGLPLFRIQNILNEQLRERSNFPEISPPAPDAQGDRRGNYGDAEAVLGKRPAWRTAEAARGSEPGASPALPLMSLTSAPRVTEVPFP